MEVSSHSSGNAEKTSMDLVTPCEKKKCECLKLIQIVVDGEATPEEHQYFKNHIAECLSCFDQYNLDKTVKDALKSKITQISVPFELINTIKQRIDYNIY